MTTPVEVLTRWFAAHAAGDLPAARALTAENVDILVPDARLHGFDAFMHWYGERAAAYGSSFQYVVRDVCGGETHACAVLALSTDERSWRQVAVYEVLDGLIVSIWAAEEPD